MTETRPRQVRLVLGYRHIFFGTVMLLFLMAIFTSLTLLIRQVANPVSVEAGNETGSELVISVDPVTDTAVAGTHTRRDDEVVYEIEPVSGETSELLRPVDPPPPSATFLLGDPTGGLYLRFGALNESLASLYVKYLSARALPAITSVGPTGQRNWVRVGPAADESQLTRLRTDLANAGFVAN